MHSDSLIAALAIALLLGISLASAEPHTNWQEVLQVGLPLCLAGVVTVAYWLRRQQPRRARPVQPRGLFMVWVNIRWEGLGRRDQGA